MEIIGRKERVKLTKFSFINLTAKIDTGAYTSAIHCHEIKEIERNGKKQLHFRLLDPEHPKYNDKLLKFSEYSQKLVKSSNGKSQKRYIIKTEIQIGGKKYNIEFTLTNRIKMKYPILLGRKFIRRRFIVDVSKVNSLKTKKSI